MLTFEVTSFDIGYNYILGRPFLLNQGITVTPASTQRVTDQLVADEKKGATNKEIQVDPTDADKRLHIIAELEAK
jgi:hypothetical protein